MSQENLTWSKITVAYSHHIPSRSNGVDRARIGENRCGKAFRRVWMAIGIVINRAFFSDLFDFVGKISDFSIK